jgi:hypothetical protein
MTTSQSIKEIATALCKAQSEFKAVTKDANNPFYKSKYATLDNVIATVKPILAKNGLSITQGNDEAIHEQEVLVITYLMHTSGEFIRSELTLPTVKNDPQGFGSAISYARRYAYASILGLATEEDDDGNLASTKNGTVASPVKAQLYKAKYTPQPVKKATEPCSECGAVGDYHRPGCALDPNMPN